MSLSRDQRNPDLSEAATAAYEYKKILQVQKQPDDAQPSEVSYQISADSAAEQAATVDANLLSGFKIIGVLGRGGMGVVYEAIELELNRRVALKVLPATALVDSAQIARFKNEARAVAQLQHANIVPVYRVGSERSIHYYAMQLIEGQNLAQIIKYISTTLAENRAASEADTRRRGSSKTHDVARAPVSTASSPSSRLRHLNAEDFFQAHSSRRGATPSKQLFQAVALMGAEIADGLAHAHDNGVIHRDIKPSNIVVDEDGKPWITDFGLAHVRDAPNATRTGDILGTLRYMSPEQASGRRFLVDHRTDIYSLGVTLYELISLRKPFDGYEAHELIRHVCFEELPSLRSLNPSVPDELEIIISKAIAKNPQERYETAADFADDLHRYAADRPIKARRASVRMLAKRWISRHQTAAVSAGIILIVTLLTSLGAAGSIWNALVAEKEMRHRAEDLLRKSEGLRLTAHAALRLPENPGLSLALAVKAAGLTSGTEVNAALVAAMQANHELKTLHVRDKVESSIDISADGRYAVSTLGSNAADPELASAVVTDLAKGTTVSELKDRKAISSAVFQPHQIRVLTASSQGIRRLKDEPFPSHQSAPATLWDWANGNRQIVFSDSSPPVVRKDCFSEDGRTLVLPCVDNVAALYRADSGQRMISFRGHAAQVMSAVLSRDGKLAASADASGQVCVWDTSTAALIKRIQAASTFGTGSALALSMDGAILIVTGPNGGRAYSVTGVDTEPRHRWQETRVAINPQLNHAACYWDIGKVLIIRDVSTGAVLAEHEFSGGIRTVQYMDDGRRLLVAAGSDIQVINELFGSSIASFRGHTGHVTNMAVSGRSDSVLSSSVDKTVRHWSVQSTWDRRSLDVKAWGDLPTRFNTDSSDRYIATGAATDYETYIFSDNNVELRRAAGGKVHRGVFDSHRLVSFGEHSIQIVDASTSRKISETPVTQGAIRDAMICPSHNTVLIILFDGSAVLWDFVEQRMMKLSTAANPCTTWEVSDDGATIALGLADGVCELRDAASGAIQRELKHAATVQSIQFLPASGRLLTLDGRGSVHLWEGEVDQPRRSFTLSSSRFHEIAASEPQNLVVAYSLLGPGKVSAWNYESGEQLQTLDVRKLQHAALHPNLPAYALASPTTGVQLWNPVDGSVTTLTTHAATDVAFFKDSLLVAETGPQARTLKLPMSSEQVISAPALKTFDARTGELMREIELPYEPTTISIDRKTGTAALSAMTWAVVIADWQRAVISRSQSFSAPITVVRRVGQTDTWAIAGNDGHASILDRGGELLRDLSTTKTPIQTGSVSTDGKLFATGDLRGTIRIWDIGSGKEVGSYSEADSPIRSLEFDATDHFLIASDEAGRFRQIDVRTGMIRSLDFADGIQAIHLSRDGQLALVVVGRDKWSSSSGDARLLNTYKANAVIGKAAIVKLADLSLQHIEHPPQVIAAAFAADSKTLALAGADAVITIVDRESLEVVQTIDCKPRGLMAVAFGPDSGTLATLDKTGVRIWDLASGALRVEFTSDLHARSFGPIPDRNYWQPFVDGNVMSFGVRMQLFPIRPIDVANAAAPRTLTPDELKAYRIDDLDTGPIN